MIKIMKSNNSNYINKLNVFLEKRREGKNQDEILVKKILKDVKKNKLKAVIKYELKFSNNREIKLSSNRINKVIKKLEPKVKKAIDFAYERIFKFHSQQFKSLKNIYFKDKYEKEPWSLLLKCFIFGLISAFLAGQTNSFLFIFWRARRDSNSRPPD